MIHDTVKVLQNHLEHKDTLTQNMLR